MKQKTQGSETGKSGMKDFLQRQIAKQTERKKAEQAAEKAAEAARRKPAYLRKETAVYLIAALFFFALTAALADLTSAAVIGALLLIPAVVAQVAEVHQWVYSLYALILSGLLIGLLLLGQTAWLVLTIVWAVLGLLALLSIRFMGLE